MTGKPLRVRSEHQLMLGERALDYQVLRSNQRKSLSLKIDAHGLSVLAPLFSTLSEIERAILAHGPWITKKLEEWQAFSAEADAFGRSGLVWCLGRQIPLHTVAADEAIPRPLGEEELTHLPFIPIAEGVVHPEAALIAWYRVQALPWFRRRLQIFSDRVGIRPLKLALSDAKARWGSCSHQDIIRLNWRLIQAHPSEIDYVVAHECAHLRHMHHQAQFWETLTEIYPEWKAAEASLKRHDRRYRSL